MKFTTHNNTKKLYSKNKNLKYTCAFILIPLTIFLLLFVWALNDFNKEYLKIMTPTIQAPETYIALVNGRETVIYEYPDGRKSFAVQYEYCRPLSFMDDCRMEREIIRFNVK